jgi:hypothetical protein
MTDKNEADSTRHENQLKEEEMDFFNDIPDTGPPSSTKESNNKDREELLRRSTEQLKSSILNIGTTVDHQFGITKKAQDIDKSVKISTTAKSAATCLTAWAQSVNEKYHVAETTGDMWRQVNERWKVAETASAIGSKIQKYDEKTGVSTRAVTALAKGAEFVEQRIVKTEQQEKKQAQADSEGQDGIEMEDKGKSSS